MGLRTGAMVTAAAMALALTACTGGSEIRPTAPGPSGSAGESAAATSASSSGHVNNPYAGADMYVNQEWARNVLATAADTSDAELAAAMESIADQPTAVWLDRIAAIEGVDGKPGLVEHLDAALTQAEGDRPVAVTLVVYDLPGRDCFALASNGELPATEDGFTRYREDFIDPIAEILGRPEYEDLRVVTVLEPDSLPNLVTNSSHAACQQAAPYYRDGLVYALDAFAPLEHVYAYLDAAHSGWLGWPDNAGGTVALFAEVVQATEAGFLSIDGFVTNTANTTPLEEPFLDPEDTVGGQQVKAASFYEHNPDLDEVSWAADLWSRAVASGFPETTGIVIDTSRNGWGGPGRPTAVSTSTDLETYVDASRVDRRVHRGAWCNPAGTGLGMRPQALPDGFPEAHLDAFLWVKPPGESDGASTAVENDQGKGFDSMCDPDFSSDRLGGEVTEALANAPLSGEWFAAQFLGLVANAYPPLGQAATPARADKDAFRTVEEVLGDDAAAPSAAPSASPDATGTSTAPASGDASAEPGGASSRDVDLPVPEAGCEAILVVPDAWDGGYRAEVTVIAGEALPGWTVTLPEDTRVQQLWNGETAGRTVTPAAWNAALASGATATFGWVGEGAVPTPGALECAPG